MTGRLTIREGREGDIEGIISMWMALQEEHAIRDARYEVAPSAERRYRNDIGEYLKAEVWRIVVALDDDQPAGFASARHWYPEPIYRQCLEVFVESIYVEPARRRTGVGTALYQSIRSWAEAIGAERLRLGALARNGEALAFWHKVSAKQDIIVLTVELEGRPQ